MIRKVLSRLLLAAAPAYFEARRARLLGICYPEFFDTTRSIFIHIPKAAGTSVGMALYGRQIPHHTWHTWHSLNPRKFQQYFKFAVLREPTSRFLSAFSYLKTGGMNEHDRTFGEMVLRDFPTADSLAEALLDGPLQKQILAGIHFRPQAEFVADAAGNSQMDLLIPFENIDPGFQKIVQRLNCGPRTLPQLNVTRDKPAEQLSANSRAILECLYQRDYQLWQHCDR